jgi:hypothetical protein
MTLFGCASGVTCATKKGQIRKIFLIAIVIKILNKWMKNKKTTPSFKGMLGRALSDSDSLWTLIL